MKISRIILILLLVTIFAKPANSIFAQADQESVMNLVKPNENHQILYQLEGAWKQNIWFNSGEEPFYTSGETKNEVIYGGRFLEITGTMIVLEAPVKTTTYIGYDNTLNKYFIFSIDELGTQPVNAYGDYDKKTRQLVFTGTTTDPLKKKKSTYRIVITFERENKFVQQFFMNDGKKEIKKMEIVNIKKPE